MIVATTPFIAGHRVIETKGQVFGLVVRSRGFSGNLIAGLRSLVGGEIKEYTALLEDTRRQALDRLVKNATLMGANAVHLDALRQLRAGQHDVGDRGVRHRRRRRARRRRAAADQRVVDGLDRATTASADRSAVGALIALAGLAARGIGGSRAGRPVADRHRGRCIVVAVVLERQRYRSEEADELVRPGRPGRRRADRRARAAFPADRRDVRRPDDRPARCASTSTRGPASGATSPRPEPGAARDRSVTPSVVNGRVLSSAARRAETGRPDQ